MNRVAVGLSLQVLALAVKWTAVEVVSLTIRADRSRMGCRCCRIVGQSTEFPVAIDNPNFYIYVDKSGKMPVLSHIKLDIIHHPYFIQYRSNRPVAYHGPKNILVENINNDSVWCFARAKFVPIDNLKAI